MSQPERQRIRNTARERGWSEETGSIRSMTFRKGHRAVFVTFSPDGQTATRAFHGTKRITGRNLAQQVIDTLKKE